MTTCVIADEVRVSKPWYRERWPWLLMAGPAIVVLAGFITGYIAWASYDGVVAEDYYKRGLLINRQLGRLALADSLQLGALVSIDERGEVRARMTGGSTDASQPDALRLKLVHPTRSGQDRIATLARGADGVYRGRIVSPLVGRWQLTLETDAWELAATTITGSEREVRLGAARVPQ
jgi:uncharacterized protein